MKKLGFLILALSLLSTSVCFAEVKGLLIDDFEGTITGGPDGTVDFGAGNGSSVDVKPDVAIKYLATQSLKVIYDAIPGGYIYVARGFGLDAKNSGWLVKPEAIDWTQYNAIAFYMYGSDSGTAVAIDLKDNNNEMWRYVVIDDFKGWQQIICPFEEFSARNDWQPDNADKNGVMDFPIKSYQFEPRPEARGTLYFDDVELVKR